MIYYSALRTVLDSSPSYGSLTLLNFWIIYPKGVALSPHSIPHAAGSPGMISVDFVEFNLPSIGRYCIDPFPSVVASASLGREENLFSFVFGGRI
ncbi:hypothetical protein Mp_7g00940 [Marchantia polymorpha subsp. ruderalis]|uniref:Uncharacterized protein n=1 Tax=Marchantia polymorpha subsp. ruderalis TaxID=1480154 RepID=A0AAF6BUW5_MARPO|nr:hypothetical protein Mp_7g00940 [Marchantia polymorpha subsp. ruderalis]